MNEKLEKQKLEERIQSMQSQLLIGGHKIEDTPAFRSLLQQEHKRIRTEYEQRLAELEKERHTVEEDKAQVNLFLHFLKVDRKTVCRILTMGASRRSNISPTSLIA